MKPKWNVDVLLPQIVQKAARCLPTNECRQYHFRGVARNIPALVKPSSHDYLKKSVATYASPAMDQYIWQLLQRNHKPSHFIWKSIVLQRPDIQNTVISVAPATSICSAQGNN